MKWKPTIFQVHVVHVGWVGMKWKPTIFQVHVGWVGMKWKPTIFQGSTCGNPPFFKVHVETHHFSR